MSNIDLRDVLNSIKKIEEDCKKAPNVGDPAEVEYKKFYERITGMVTVLDQHLNKRVGGGTYG